MSTNNSLPRPVSENNPLVNALLRAMRDARTELRLNDAKAALNILSETLDDYAAGLLPLDAAPTTPPPPPAAAPDGDVTAAQSLLASISEPLKLTPADAAHFAAKADERESAPARPTRLTAAQRRILKRIDKREQKGIPLQLSEATLAEKRQLVRLGQMRLLKTLYPETDRTGLVLTDAGRDALTPPPAAAAPQPAIAWDAPAPADAAEWLDKPFTKVAPPATANEYERLETVVLHGFDHAPRINYANLTDSLQEAARRLMARGELVRDGDYIMQASAAPASLTAAQWWYDTLDSAPYHETDERQLSNMACGPFATQADALADQAKRKPAAPAPTVKLTKPQRAILERLDKGETIRYNEYNLQYRSLTDGKCLIKQVIDNLLKMDLVKHVTAATPHGMKTSLVLTALGQRALEGR